MNMEWGLYFAILIYSYSIFRFLYLPATFYLSSSTFIFFLLFIIEDNSSYFIHKRANTRFNKWRIWADTRVISNKIWNYDIIITDVARNSKRWGTRSEANEYFSATISRKRSKFSTPINCETVKRYIFIWILQKRTSRLQINFWSRSTI